MASPLRKQWRLLAAMGTLVVALWGIVLGMSYEPQLGLDLQGGISVVLAPKAGQPIQDGALEQAVDIIRNRVDALGVAEPDIATQGNTILIQLPGIEEQQRALDLIGTTAKLRFRPVLQQIPPPAPGATRPPGIPDCTDPNTFPEDDPAKEIVLCQTPQEGLEGQPLLRLGAAALEGEDVADASAQLDPQGALGWFVSLDLNDRGAAKFQQITGQLACNRGQAPRDQLAIVLDRRIESAPQMGENVQCNQGIGGGNAQITGSFTDREAKDLSLVLRYGALPVELERLAITEVSPTLGREALRGGLLAGVIGVAIVFVYVLLFYRGLGLVIWTGLSVHGAFTLAIVILLGQLAGFSLTLAGIAGLIVSIGIAADSFIVYFERIKDEVLTGMSARAAIERAWVSARRTIIAADLVTALAAGILYFLAVGSVRGFALMLGIATALDLFVSFWFMHPSVSILANTRALGRSKTLGLRAAPRVDGSAS